MTKAINMLSILWLLKTSKRMTAKQLAEELEINIRTVYRYIDSLCASGVPIISDTGHNGGYSLLHDFTKVPLFFDLNEQKALIHAARFASEAGYPFNQSLDAAVTKLKKYTNQEQLANINRHLVGFDVIQPPSNLALESHLQEIEVSVAEGFTLLMDYQKGNESTFRSRSINPYGLVYWKGNWYVIAYCHLRLEIRNFRVSRIVSISRTGDRFDRPSDFSAREFLLNGILPDFDQPEQLTIIHIEGYKHALDELCQHWLFGHALFQRSETHAYFKIDEQAINTYVPYFLLPYGKAINILEPLLLKKRMITVTQELVKHYQSSDLH
jgi:predicted DNA-binding transcriptional regulator YafY